MSPTSFVNAASRVLYHQNEKKSPREGEQDRVSLHNTWDTFVEAHCHLSAVQERHWPSALPGSFLIQLLDGVLQLGLPGDFSMDAVVVVVIVVKVLGVIVFVVAVLVVRVCAGSDS